MKKKLMQIVLVKEVKNLGKPGDEVSVKPGYGRNFLLPEGLAVLATPVAIEKAKKVREERQKKEKEMIANLKKQLVDIKKVTLTFVEKVKKSDKKLYGSIGTTEIVKKAKEEGIELKKSWLVMDGPIKELGKKEIEIKPHEDLSGFITVDVQAEKGTEEEE